MAILNDLPERLVIRYGSSRRHSEGREGYTVEMNMKQNLADQVKAARAASSEARERSLRARAEFLEAFPTELCVRCDRPRRRHQRACDTCLQSEADVIVLDAQQHPRRTWIRAAAAAALFLTVVLVLAWASYATGQSLVAF